MRRALLVLAAVLVGTAASVGAPVTAAGAQERRIVADRVLVVSLPGLTWGEVQEHDLPAIEGFLADSAVADLAPRSVRHASRAGDAYLTIGAGTRAVGDPDVDGEQLAADDQYAGEPAGGVYERRTGEGAAGEIVSLPWPSLVRDNAAEPYDVVLGLLADTLHEAGVATAAIGNADGSDTAVISYERQVALALTGTEGRLDGGSVSADLLTRDPTQPFGVRLDEEATLMAFDDAWDVDGRMVAVVEASDLARSLRYRPFVDRARGDELRAEALDHADGLVASLLERTDPERDAVMLVAPFIQGGRVTLTVVGLQRPGHPVGYLGSASTQRSGIVTLVDVAPTILEALGIPRPTEMEGRPIEITRSSASFDDRVERLVAINEGSRFRERLLTPTTIALVLLLAAVVAAAIVAVVSGRHGRIRRVIAFAALADLAGLPVSYLARAFPLEDLGAAFYWAFLVAGSLAVAAAATAIGRRAGRPVAGLAVVLGLGLLVLVGDVMTGSNLHLSAAFGYSPTGNSRLYGISNYSFGLLSAASCLLAAFIANRWPSRAGRAGAMALMLFSLVVLGVPIWGSDVGGIIAFTPTVLVFGALLLRVRPSVRWVLLVGLLTVAAVVAFGLIDLARPEAQRAHLGRLFERVGREGLEPLLSIMERKLLANLRVSTSSFWVAAVPIALACWLFLRRWHTRPLAAVHARISTLHAALVAGVVAAVLGSLANDSGAIVGGVAALVIAASLVHLTLDPGEA